MSLSSASATSASLIERVIGRDEDAWRRLAEIYTPLVYSWSRRGGLQNSDAVDVVQEVFRSVLRGIEGFRRGEAGGSFRAWLWSITRNQVRLVYRQSQGRARPVGGSEAFQQLQQLPDWFEQAAEPDAESNARSVVHRALGVVRGDFQPATWQAFVGLAIEQRPAADVAQETGLTENAVRQAKFRVLRRLREVLDGLN